MKLEHFNNVSETVLNEEGCAVPERLGKNAHGRGGSVDYRQCVKYQPAPHRSRLQGVKRNVRLLEYSICSQYSYNDCRRHLRTVLTHNSSDF